jgi:hypothetical protein
MRFAPLAGLIDALLNLANRVEILIQFALIGGTDFLPQASCVFKHGIEHAFIAPFDLVLEQTVES